MTVKRPLPIALLLIAATSLAGCFEPIQSGGVMIVGDPSERVGALCRYRAGGSGAFCPSDAQADEDTAAVASELFVLSAGTPGGVEVVITWDAVPAARRAESRVSLRRVIEPGAATPAFPDPPSLWLTAPSDGAITAELPPGRYAAKLEGPGVISAESVAVVEAGKVTNLTLVASIFDGASQIPQKE